MAAEVAIIRPSKPPSIRPRPWWHPWADGYFAEWTVCKRAGHRADIFPDGVRVCTRCYAYLRWYNYASIAHPQQAPPVAQTAHSQRTAVGVASAGRGRATAAPIADSVGEPVGDRLAEGERALVGDPPGDVISGAVVSQWDLTRYDRKPLALETSGLSGSSQH